jgi:hypothetical protein
VAAGRVVAHREWLVTEERDLDELVGPDHLVGWHHAVLSAGHQHPAAEHWPVRLLFAALDLLSSMGAGLFPEPAKVRPTLLFSIAGLVTLWPTGEGSVGR